MASHKLVSPASVIQFKSVRSGGVNITYDCYVGLQTELLIQQIELAFVSLSSRRLFFCLLQAADNEIYSIAVSHFQYLTIRNTSIIVLVHIQ